MTHVTRDLEPLVTVFVSSQQAVLLSTVIFSCDSLRRRELVSE